MPPVKVVFAATSCATGNNGGFVQLREGDAWAADDPVVIAHPGLFSDYPLNPRRSVPATVIEQTTAAPGETRRGPGRPRLTSRG